MQNHILVIALLCSSGAIAKQADSINNPHSVFISGSLGDATLKHKSVKDGSHDVDDNTTTQIGYRYQFDKTFSADLRYIKSASLGFKQVVSLGLLDGTIDYSVVALNGQARTAVMKNTYLYADLGITRYQWAYATSKQKTDDAGLGSLFSVGIKYQWRPAELSFEHQWLKMGNMKASNFTLGVGYRF